MNKRYIWVSIDDERAKKIAGVLGNKTCKKIIEFLSDKNESGEKDISDALKMPINTVEYNVKKLIGAELIEKTKNFFWSKKGKKIKMYKLSNKSIIISPKASNINFKIKSLVLVFGISGIMGLLIRQLTIRNVVRNNENVLSSAGQKVIEVSSEGAQTAASVGENFFLATPIWVWFLTGALFAIIIFTLVNWNSNIIERRKI